MYSFKEPKVSVAPWQCLKVTPVIRGRVGDILKLLCSKINSTTEDILEMFHSELNSFCILCTWKSTLTLPRVLS